ncbi:MAG: PspA/IM30 family protein, partial [Sphaerospermopsis sp.]|nr:PspA/IM30 family protein [Sphaerospermopsis sp.]
MEEKVLMQEARAQSTAELVGGTLESQFAQLEGSSDVDDELAALKASMLSPAAPQPQLPPQKQPTNTQQTTTTAKSAEPVDSELEALKRQLDQL